MKTVNRKQQILVVDDSPANIRLLAAALKNKYDVTAATNGPAALEIARSADAPDLILLDIMMPGIDGYQVCRELKSEVTTKDIPVIFVTSKSDQSDETTGLELGAVDYITKPFSLPVVQARVQTHLELKRKTDFLEELSYLDGLTGIPNRRRFDLTMEREWRRAAHAKSWLSVIMADIDFFKAFNDYYGHSKGDECLKLVAMGLNTVAKRPGDFLARYGGEEFALVLPGSDENGAAAAAESCARPLSAEHRSSIFSGLGPGNYKSRSRIDDPLLGDVARNASGHGGQDGLRGKAGGRNMAMTTVSPRSWSEVPAVYRNRAGANADRTSDVQRIELSGRTHGVEIARANRG